MPGNFYTANLNWEQRTDSVVRLAIRPAVSAGRPWPFPEGTSIAAVGTWRVNEPSPILLIREFFEVADAPARPYEQPVSVLVYRANPQESLVRTRNVLTSQLAAELPAIGVKTAENLRDWSDFLAWKRKLLAEQTMGLRYVQVEWKDDNLVFTVLAETEESLRESYAAIQRDDATAFAPAVSSDPWTFRIGRWD